MSEQPDLSTLPQRMRYAASVLEEAVKHADLSADTDWTPQLLRGDADIWERDVLAEELAAELSARFAGWMGDMPSSMCRTAATRMIENGWRRGDPE